MAGKHAAASTTAPAPPAKSSPATPQPAAMNWRLEIDRNTKRLQSLLFGADAALGNRDFAAAEILSLRLIGFLKSRCRSEVDEAFVRKIEKEAVSKLEMARRALREGLDRQAFEGAGRAPENCFSKIGDIDVDKIKKSKHFRALLQQSSRREDQHCQEDTKREEKHIASKPTYSAKASALFGKNISSVANIIEKRALKYGSENSDDCMILEKQHSGYVHPKGFTTNISSEEERRMPENMVKRHHKEARSPRNEWSKSPISSEEAECESSGNGFVTAKTKLEMDVKKRRGGLVGFPNASISPQCDNNSTGRASGLRSYGVSRRGIRGNFVPPIRSNGSNNGNLTPRVGGSGKVDDSLDDSTKRWWACEQGGRGKKKKTNEALLDMLCGPDGELPDKLRNLEPRLIEHVSNEIMDKDPNVRWNDIGNKIPEMGTGKTMIGKAIAGEAKATFFYISASSLTSKWIGEGEKLVRALFGVASCRQPAVIFVDEIDSLLSQRKSDGEHEASRRMKTQFLIEMEGFDSGSEQILLIGELLSHTLALYFLYSIKRLGLAASCKKEQQIGHRSLMKQLGGDSPSDSISLSLPQIYGHKEARAWIIQNLLEKDGLFKLSMEDINEICELTEGYSGSDMKNLVKDASMGPLRDVLRQGIEITKINKEDIRPVTLQDFKESLQEVRPSVSANELGDPLRGSFKNATSRRFSAV
ncbi:ATPase family AAA domain-containing protein [Drosera capensis]